MIASEKYRKAVSGILGDLSKVKGKEAVQIPLSSLNGEKMQNLRSALNRVTRDKNIPVATSSDDKYMYIWRGHLPNYRNKRVARAGAVRSNKCR